jgi:hypothetical protein
VEILLWVVLVVEVVGEQHKELQEELQLEVEMEELEILVQTMLQQEVFQVGVAVVLRLVILVQAEKGNV